MRKMVGVKEAVAETGLSEYELRRGVREGIYPHIRIGEGRGKFLFDLDLLNETIHKRMIASIQGEEEMPENVVPFGVRRIEA